MRIVKIITEIKKPKVTASVSVVTNISPSYFSKVAFQLVVSHTVVNERETWNVEEKMITSSYYLLHIFAIEGKSRNIKDINITLIIKLIFR